MFSRTTTLIGAAGLVLALAIASASGPSARAAGPVTVGLGSAASFAVLAGSGITNTGPSVITGDIGTFPTTTTTGFPPGTVSGTNHGGDGVTQGAKSDLVTAYNDAAGRASVITVPTELGGTTLTPGTYESTAGTFGITGNLTLNGQGDQNAVFIFKMASTLTTATNSSVSLVNGAQSCNVFWQVGSSATLGTSTSFRGNILALTSITLVTGASMDGRALARNGAVTLDTNRITATACSFTEPATPVPATATPVPATATPVPATATPPIAPTPSPAPAATVAPTASPSAPIATLPSTGTAGGPGPLEIAGPVVLVVGIGLLLRRRRLAPAVGSDR